MERQRALGPAEPGMSNLECSDSKDPYAAPVVQRNGNGSVIQSCQ